MREIAEYGSFALVCITGLLALWSFLRLPRSYQALFTFAAAAIITAAYQAERHAEEKERAKLRAVGAELCERTGAQILGPAASSKFTCSTEDQCTCSVEEISAKEDSV